jgi:hypothetical protein
MGADDRPHRPPGRDVHREQVRAGEPVSGQTVPDGQVG